MSKHKIIHTKRVAKCAEPAKSVDTYYLRELLATYRQLHLLFGDPMWGGDGSPEWVLEAEFDDGSSVVFTIYWWAKHKGTLDEPIDMLLPFHVGGTRENEWKVDKAIRYMMSLV